MKTAQAIKVEKGVPLISNSGRRPGDYKYPWRKLRVGDSFFVPEWSARKVAVQASACLASKRHGKKFTARSVDGGTRVWRLS